MHFEASCSLCADKGKRTFVWRLVLVQGERRQNSFVPADDMDGVLDFNPFEKLVCGVGDQFCNGADDPFGGIYDMRKSILHRSAARNATFIICLAVSRTIKWKMLSRGGNHLDHFTEAPAADSVAHGRQCGVRAVHISNSGNDLSFCHLVTQRINS